MDENQGLELTPENVDTVLDEIRCGHCLRGSLLASGGCDGRWARDQNGRCAPRTKSRGAAVAVHKVRQCASLACCGRQSLQRAMRAAAPASLMQMHPCGVCRPYLVGTGGGGLELVELDGPIAKVSCAAGWSRE